MKLFDMHCDTIYKICSDDSNLFLNDGHISLDKVKGFDSYGQIFALFCGEKVYTSSEYETLLSKLINTAQNQFEQNKSKILLCKSKKDIENAVQNGKISAILSIEGAELIQNDEALTKAYDAGVRFVNISWNHKNKYACGAMHADENLTDEGKLFVKKLRQIGIIPDVSHLSEKGFWDLIDLDQGTLVASHSNSASICKHKRNLTDDQIPAIAKRNGVIGLNIYSKFLTKSGEATTDDIVRHIDKFLELSCEKNLALGCDFDGCDSLPKEINDVRDMEKLYNELLRRNYNENLICDIFYNNLYKFLIDNM